MDNNIAFSKIAATPALNSWAQAYNAGKLFAVLSLEKSQELPQEIESLNILGKDLLEKLEQEFFTIENKDLDSIRNAITNTFQNQIEGIKFSFAASAFVNNVLYLFSLGKGKVFIKRYGNFGLVLESPDEAKEIVSSSGFLKDADLIVLATHAFSEAISNEELNAALNNSLPSEIAESLAPKIHKADDGKISAIIIKYGKPQANPSETQDEIEDTTQTTIPAEKPDNFFKKYLFLLKSKSAGWLEKSDLKIHPSKKPLLILTVIIAGILIFSIFTAVKQQNNARIKTLFENVYSQAQKKYDDGQSILDLNKNSARDSFSSAQKILNENKIKFPKNSKEEKQILELLKKVQTGLTQVSPLDKSGLDRSKLSIIAQNGSGIEGTAGKASAILKELGYNISSTGNADNYNYKGITIKVKDSKKDFVDLLKKDLSKDYAITSTSSDLPPSSASDAVIIIGK